MNKAPNKTPRRAVCSHCHYPEAVCVCSAIATVECNSHLEILQHPNETQCAKNSARLVPLCVSNCNIWVGESASDFTQLKQNVQGSPLKTLLVYPSDAATSVADLKLPLSQKSLGVRILLIDGTWRKAYKIWQLNPWLHALPQILITRRSSNYLIRKAPKDYYLSTLEAAAYCLEEIEGCDVAPLHNCFALMQQPFINFRKG